ncbi:MAG: hypothetical protein C4B59_12570 [Candidatus Methanogaster sp.]|uniref:Uncharacterized protein n=1 Tax=Candidatus Methanogaster sp. TaxID=3386292 RepID=A0AC61L0I0_9EURY|nr:MAG: hypothetical protein C4B59_12570 [ANME-2 cluster archaeon]
MSGRLHAEAKAASKSSFAPVRTGLLAGYRGKQLVSQPPLVQTKLTVGQPNDRYEQEADRVADAVMRMPELGVQRQVEPEEEEEALRTKPLAAQITPLIQRQVESEDEEEEELIQAEYTGGQTPQLGPNMEAQINALRSGGQPLDPTTRAFMEPRFSHDFSRVRVHTDSKAAESAHAVNAHAYTVVRNIVFGTGHYSPRTSEEQKLLAHELAHVVQQSRQRAQGEDAVFVQRYPSHTPHGEPYTAGLMHDHRPSGRWADIQALEWRRCPASSISCACSTLSPRSVLNTAAGVTMGRKPFALHHLLHYMFGGGADYVEDVRDFIVRDSGVRGILASFIRSLTATKGHFKVYQHDYAVQDFRLAFGAIDRLDYEVDSAAGVVHVWFVDRYEFHPVYPGFYRMMTGDVARVTNCVHAAAVELKTSGAADFWMVGYGTVPLSTVTGSAPSGGGTTL